MTGMVQLIKTQGTIANRTDMHTSVRSATELLQQEIGQAGKVSLGAPADTITLGTAVNIASNPNPVTLASTSSFRPGPLCRRSADYRCGEQARNNYGWRHCFRTDGYVCKGACPRCAGVRAGRLCYWRCSAWHCCARDDMCRRLRFLAYGPQAVRRHSTATAE